MASQQSQKPPGVPNPYAPKGLPNPYALATVAESAPVRYSDAQARAEQQKKSTAFHNPHNIKRPQAKGNTAKKPSRPTMSSSSSDPAPAVTTSQQPGLDWWRSTEDDDAAALEYKRQLDKQQKEKKKLEKKFVKQYGYFKGEAPYKPERHTNMRAYKASGGYRRTLDSFDAYLLAQPGPSRSRKNSSEQSRASRQASTPGSAPTTSGRKPQFAPPAMYGGGSAPSPSAAVPDDPSGDEAYARRARLSAAVPPPPPPPPSSDPSDHNPPPPPPPPEAQDENPPPPPPPPSSAPYNPTISAPPVRYNPTISAPPVHYGSATISAPPVRYDVTDAQMDNRERPAKRPKLSKAEAMMAKMGYVKGQGLGKNSDGITTHLEVKARRTAKNEKRRVDISDDLDDESGRNVKSQQVFDILGGHRDKQKEPGRFGDESTVVVAWGCVDDIDWAADAARNDGGIRQEMGQIFGTKFGRIEQVKVNMSSDPQTVYIKFTSELSALNAVNRFHEGYQFRGRNIRALFYDETKFNLGELDH